MSDHFSQLSDDSEKVIDLPVDSSRFARLMKILDRERKGDVYKWEELEEVLELGKTYDFVALPELVSFSARKCITGPTAWRIFRFASQNDFLGLAKAAIALLSSQRPSDDFKDLAPSVFKDLPGDYSVALLQAMAKYPYRPNVSSDERWRQISMAFAI
jgi:hypothetical protein